MFPDQTSVWLPFDETEAEPEALQADRVEKNLRHIFVSKTVRMPVKSFRSSSLTSADI